MTIAQTDDVPNKAYYQLHSLRGTLRPTAYTDGPGKICSALDPNFSVGTP